MANGYDAIVIGAGANGLVAAAELGRAGLRVLLLEEQNEAGGQVRTLEFAPGFHAAPLVNEGGWIPPAVARTVGTNVAQITSQAQLSVAAGPGEFLEIAASPARASEAISRYSARDAAAWPAFMTQLHNVAGFLAALYQNPAPDIAASAAGELFQMLGLARKFRALGRADMTQLLRILPMSIQELLDDTFECEPLKAAVAAHGVRDTRQGPRAGGTTFVLLHYLAGTAAGALRHRRWHIGPDAFIRAAHDAAQRQRVALRTGARVSRITVHDDAVTGVVLDNGEEIAAPRVISTADPKRTLLGLVDPVWLDPEFLRSVQNIKLRGCTSVLLYALDALPDLPGLEPENLRGVISVTPDTDALERAADAVKYGELADQPHIEFTVPTLRWPDRNFAPPGKHVLVARVQYSPWRGQEGAAQAAAQRARLEENVTRAIEAVSPCFSSRVLHRQALAPHDIEQEFGLTEGALTQGELTLDQILFMRPVAGYARHDTPVAGLYLGGAGTHPGPGILGGPGVLAAARILRRTNGQKSQNTRKARG